MTIKEAMKAFFEKQKDLYMETFGTLPTVPYNRNADPSLYVGEPDEDEEIQWVYSEAKRIEVSGLSTELTDFYSSYYYWELRGRLDNTSYYFPHVINMDEAVRTAEFALERGKEFFPEENNAVIAYCKISGNDGLVLVYNQDDSSLFIYDCEADNRSLCNNTLTETISLMEAII